MAREIRRHAKTKKGYKKCCQDLMNAHEEVVRLNCRIGGLKDVIDEYVHLMTQGCRNLKVVEWHFNGIYSVTVAGVLPRNTDMWFCVKDFHYDPTDPDGYDFAKREAEELIETIQKF